VSNHKGNDSFQSEDYASSIDEHNNSEERKGVIKAKYKKMSHFGTSKNISEYPKYFDGPNQGSHLKTVLGPDKPNTRKIGVQ